MTWKEDIKKNERITYTNTTQDNSDYYTDKAMARKKAEKLMEVQGILNNIRASDISPSTERAIRMAQKLINEVING